MSDYIIIAGGRRPYGPIRRFWLRITRRGLWSPFNRDGSIKDGWHPIGAMREEDMRGKPT